MNFESNILGHDNGNNFNLADFELFSLLGVLSEGLADGLQVLGVRV